MKPVHFHPEAKAELDDAITYYERQREGLGQDFLAEVTEASERIQRSLVASPLVPGTSFCKCLVKRFPYLLIYEEQEEFLWIAAVAHAKRRPGYWKHRSIYD